MKKYVGEMAVVKNFTRQNYGLGEIPVHLAINFRYIVYYSSCYS